MKKYRGLPTEQDLIAIAVEQGAGVLVATRTARAFIAEMAKHEAKSDD